MQLLLRGIKCWYQHFIQFLTGIKKRKHLIQIVAFLGVSKCQLLVRARLKFAFEEHIKAIDEKYYILFTHISKWIEDNHQEYFQGRLNRQHTTRSGLKCIMDH